MNDLDNKFKQGLEDFTSLPSPAVWEAVEAGLDAAAGSKKSRVVPMWGWASTAVASIALALFLIPFKSPTPYHPRTEPAQQENISAPSPNLVDFAELAVEEPIQEVLPENNTPATPARIVSPAWEQTLDAYEAEMAVEADFLPFDRIQAEWIQEPVKVIIDFKEPESTEFYAAIDQSSLLEKTAGATARLVGENIARIVGKSTINWEVAKNRIGVLSAVSKTRTPKKQ